MDERRYCDPSIATVTFQHPNEDGEEIARLTLSASITPKFSVAGRRVLFLGQLTVRCPTVHIRYFNGDDGHNEDESELEP